MKGRQASWQLAIGTLARHVVLLAAAAVATLVGFAAPSRADEYGRLFAIEENDGLLPDHWDRHYTQGAMLAYLSPTLKPDAWSMPIYDGISAYTPLFQPGPGVQRKFDVVVGQTIFTPVKYHDIPPNPRDRPFAGFLFTGGSLLQDTNGRMLENLELLAGVVGPDSLAKDAQIWFHSAAGFNNRNLNQAWNYQLRNEPGFMLTYERKWKVWQASFLGVEFGLYPRSRLHRRQRDDLWLGRGDLPDRPEPRRRLRRRADSSFAQRYDLVRRLPPDPEVSAGTSSPAYRAARWRRTFSSTATPSQTARM